MERARLRALTHSNCLLIWSHEAGGRNGESPIKGIDTSIPLVNTSVMFYVEMERTRLRA